jgi:murein DD-endopeptidase MepM/ murein hydrolase activator NlpD
MMIFCKHPLEWDKTKYDSALIRNRLCSGDEGLHDILREKAEKLDIWGSIKDHETIRQPANNLWFVHPVYFINHMNKAGLLDKTFNPYEGTHKTAEGVTFTCYDNPGFAPVYTVGTEVFEDRGKRFAVINGLFNDDYSRFYGRRFFHEGIDFKGIEGTKIISFVYGTVVFAGEMTAQAGYGKIMIIKDNQKDILYLLAHLSKWLINEKEPVYPDMEVAEVGKTGTKAAHLHVSVLETSESDKERIVASVSAEQYRWNISVFNLCRDPFNQTITRIP